MKSTEYSEKALHEDADTLKFSTYFSAVSELGKCLVILRSRAISSGMQLLSEEEILEETSPQKQ